MYPLTFRTFQRASRLRVQTVVHKGYVRHFSRNGLFDNLPGSSRMRPLDTLQMLSDPVIFWNKKYEIARQHDASRPMYKMNIMERPTVILFSHEMARQYQQYELQGQIKRVLLPLMHKLWGKPVDEIYGRTHMEWRGKHAKAFKPDIVDQMTPFVQRRLDAFLKHIHAVNQNTGKSVHFLDDAKRFSLEVGMKFVYGSLLSQDDRNEIYPVFEDFSQGMFAVSEHLPSFKRAYQAKFKLNEFFTAKYLEAEQLTKDSEWGNKYGADDSTCLVRSLLENEGFSGTFGRTLEDKVEFSILFAFVAYDTTATQMTNLLFAMHSHPEHTQRVRSAIMAHSELSDRNLPFTLEGLQSCNELNCFLSEALRMYPIAPFMISKVLAAKGLDFDGVTIPKEYGLVLPIPWMHYGHGSWVDASEFNPSRFDVLKGKSKSDRGIIGRYGNIPFAMGLHKCLGIHLAMMELRAFTVLLLREWEVEIDEAKMGKNGLWNRLKMMKEGVFNGKNVVMGIPHYNIHLKLHNK